MNLDERMAFRREMLYDAIRYTLETKGILGGSYRFKVAQTDRRGHRFTVMIDLSTDFLFGEGGSQGALSEVGQALSANARARYGLEVTGVYWRVDDQIKGTAPGASSGSSTHDSPATAAELAAFAAAWRTGGNAIMGAGTYESDPAPLADGTSNDQPA